MKNWKTMPKETIKISLTEFMNFVNKSGSAKSTVVSNAKNKREEEYLHYKDYWLKLREKIKTVHRKNGTHDDLKTLISEVNDDRKENYRIAIEGYCSFWKRRKMEWVDPPKKIWSIGDIKIELNPELGLVINNQIYIIKLFTTANNKLDKKHAELILTLLENELRETVESHNVHFAVLDVKRGKLFEKTNHEISLFSLIQGEAKCFETIWKSI